MRREAAIMGWHMQLVPAWYRPLDVKDLVRQRVAKTFLSGTACSSG
jgi:hypothetical protein